MSTFATNSLPLATSLEIAGDGYWRSSVGTPTELETFLTESLNSGLWTKETGSYGLEEDHMSFGQFLALIDVTARNGSLPQIDVIFNHINIFGRLPKKYLARECGLDIRGYGYCYIQDLSAVNQLAVFSRTYWYKRLKPATRHRFRVLVSEGKLLRIKEILNTVDGVLTSLMLSQPGHDWGDGYRLTDQIMVSVISNCLFDKTFLPRWKKYKKLLRKAVLSNDTPPPVDQSWSWMSKFTPFHSKTRFGATCLMNFAQTRNTGVADHSGERQSVDKLVATLTTPSVVQSHDRPGDYLAVPIQKYCIGQDFGRAMHKTHCSVSTTACYEAGVSVGGKAQAVANEVILNNGHIERYRKQITFFNDVRCCVIVYWQFIIAMFGLLFGKPPRLRDPWPRKPQTYYDLSTGQDTGRIIPYNLTGEIIFHRSISRYKENYRYFYDCNVTIIREPGPKWRAITASSIFHAEFLQPWSHATLELLRAIPEVRSGISKSRHGWELAESLSLEDPNADFLFDGFELVGLSTDLETATDYMHWDIVSNIIDTLNEIFGFPTWYGNAVKDVLTHPRRLHKDGAIIVESTIRGCLMGDPGTKTVLTALGLAATYAAKLSNRNIIARNIGDDYAAVSPDRGLLEGVLDCFTRWEMKISPDDTYMGDHIFFTEELIKIPLSPHDTIDRIKKSRRWGRSPYIDAVKGRLILDSRKNRDDYSYTPTGRITQLGRDTSYLKKGADCLSLFHLGMLLQDVCLHTEDYEGFVYFPVNITGEGKPILFGNPANVVRHWATQLNGKYVKNVLRVVREAVGYHDDHGLNARRTQILLHASTGTFRHSKDEPWRVRFKPVDDENILVHQCASIPRYERHTAGILNRLRDFIISESEIVGVQAKEQFLAHLIYGDPVENRPFKLVDIEPDEVPATVEELEKFFKIWMEDPNAFRAIRLERFFHREPVEEYLGDLHPLRVGMKLYPNYTVLRERPAGNKMEDHDAVALYEWLKEAYRDPAYSVPIPRRNISDDEIILDLNDYMKKFEHFFIVTNDRKLAQELANRRHQLNKSFRTYRLPCLVWIQARCSWREFKAPEYFHWDDNVEIDMGSYEAYMASLSNFGVSVMNRDPSQLAVPDIGPDSLYVPVRPPDTDTSTGTSIVFPIRNFPYRYEVLPRYNAS